MPVTPEELFEAIEKGDSKTVTDYLDGGGDVNLAMKNGATPLSIAVHKGHLDTTMLLLNRNANVNLAMDNGATPLLIAAHKGHLYTTRLLLNGNANVNLAMKDGATPLLIAVHKGHLDTTMLLLDRNADVNLAMKGGATPLYVAAENGHVDIVRLLIDRNADVNLVMDNGATPLFVAAENGHVDIVRLLIDRNADVNLAMDNGATPLYITVQQGKGEVSALLINAICEQNTGSMDSILPDLQTAKLAPLDDDQEENLSPNFNWTIENICKSSLSCAPLALDIILKVNLRNKNNRDRIVRVINSVGEGAMSLAVKSWVNEVAPIVKQVAADEKSSLSDFNQYYYEFEALRVRQDEGLDTLKKLSGEIDRLENHQWMRDVVKDKGMLECGKSKYLTRAVFYAHQKFKEALGGVVGADQIAKTMALNFAITVIEMQRNGVSDHVRGSLIEYGKESDRFKTVAIGLRNTRKTLGDDRPDLVLNTESEILRAVLAPGVPDLSHWMPGNHYELLAGAEPDAFELSSESQGNLKGEFAQVVKNTLKSSIISPILDELTGFKTAKATPPEKPLKEEDLKDRGGDPLAGEAPSLREEVPGSAAVASSDAKTLIGTVKESKAGAEKEGR